ncbi:LacI family DNA-binding transcriptional regulator [Paenarthrobacter nicotinovorans]|uniref:LacI family DNA-binding transcriptional regulator n=1 Tax=Paenarthrobacter nicotinovorans TaxID=29320 RepID=UPI003748A9A7
MKDIAAAAGVSTSTVSNVLNHPHLVAEHTRRRVQQFVEDLDFRPDPNAKALRGRRGHTKDQVPPGGPRDATPDSPAAPQGNAPIAWPQPTQDRPLSDAASNSLHPGARVQFSLGHESLSGIVDAVTPDGSSFWIMSDGGLGRRWICAHEITFR